MNKRKRTIGEAYRKLDAAQEHIPHAWAALMRLTGHPDRTAEYPSTHGLKVGSAEYHIAAVFKYTRVAWEMLHDHVPGDWQLCPYPDCCWGCGIEAEGWFICPHCGRLFVARYSDSDYEDIHLRRADGNQVPSGVIPELAFDFGPTWATPDEQTTGGRR